MKRQRKSREEINRDILFKAAMWELVKCTAAGIIGYFVLVVIIAAFG